MSDVFETEINDTTKVEIFPNGVINVYESCPLSSGDVYFKTAFKDDKVLSRGSYRKGETRKDDLPIAEVTYEYDDAKRKVFVRGGDFRSGEQTQGFDQEISYSRLEQMTRDATAAATEALRKVPPGFLENDGQARGR